VRPPVPYRTTAAGGHLRKGQAEADVPRRMHPQFRVLEATVSTLPWPWPRRGRLPGEVPYGCTEQLVSQAVPALVLRKRPGFGYAPLAAEASLTRAVTVLQARQNAEGAFGFWAANSHVSPLQTVYAAHFLTEARESGFPLPGGLLPRALGFLSSLGSGEPDSPADARVRAYALYVLGAQRHGGVRPA